MTADRARRTGVVLSGGGAKGAYEVGVLLALSEGRSPATGFRPLAADVLTGTSVGAYNAGFLASQYEPPFAVAVAALAEMWRRRIAGRPINCGNGVYRVRGAPFQGLDPACFTQPLADAARLAQDAAFFARFAAARTASFLRSDEPLPTRFLDSIDISAFISPQPLRELTAETLDIAALGRSPKRLVIAASDWENGRLRLFTAHDIATRFGVPAFLASAAIPGLFPPVDIEGVPFVDGGLLLNTPLSPAIAAGAETLHVIFLDPRLADQPIRPASTFEALYRVFMITVASNVQHDMLRAAMINRELELAGYVPRLRRLGQGLPRPMAAAVERVEARSMRGRPYRPLEIHSYRPAVDLGGAMGLLDFDLRFLDRLIELGYRDAVAHDCAAQGCVLPDAATDAEPAALRVAASGAVGA